LEIVAQVVGEGIEVIEEEKQVLNLEMWRFENLEIKRKIKSLFSTV